MLAFASKTKRPPGEIVRQASQSPAEASEFQFRELLDAFPAAVFTTDADGRITLFNKAAEELAGRTPQIGVDRWCVCWRLRKADGSEMPLDQCPLAQTIRQGRAVRNVPVIAERPDGSRVSLMPFPTPLHDASGKLMGAVNMLVDVTALVQAEAGSQQAAVEQAALYRFTDRLYRASAISDVFDAALDAIFAGLRCSRASILLFDDAGVMRFVAARGLSAGYKAAVEGHSPWTPGDVDPSPIFVADVADSDETPEIKRTISDEGIVALAFVPVVANGAVVGKFMLYHDRAHTFGEAEREVALTIARQLGFAIERERAREFRRRAEFEMLVSQNNLRQSEERYRAIVEGSADAIISKDLNGVIASWNKGAEIIFGYTAQEAIGRSITMLIPEENLDEEPGIIERIRRGERVEPYETVRQRKDGECIYISLSVSPVRDEQGRVVGASKIARDITERRRAEEQRILLINELNHRVKNTLATVQSLAVQTLRSTERSAEAQDLFAARLSALSRAHNLLTLESWEGADLRDVVERALAPFITGEERRVTFDGPRVRLSPRQALALSIALHELATNAAKFGALSGVTGQVAVTWETADGQLTLNWRERGGPLVEQPARNGFGSRLIKQNLSHELGGAADIQYRPEGVRAVITSPLAHI